MTDYKIETTNPEFKSLEQQPIAFFCAEYAFEDSLPLYAGGLGVLAGDYVMEAGSQGLPFVALGLFYNKGFATYAPQAGKEGQVIDPQKAGLALLKNKDGQAVRVSVPIANRLVQIQVWVRIYNSAHVFLLDTNIEENSDEDQLITEHLYPPDTKKKLLQELILGFGGLRLLRELGLDPSVYHLNEGHTGMTVLALLKEYMDQHPEDPSVKNVLQKIKPKIVATKHTILPTAGIYIERKMLKELAGHCFEENKINFEEFFELGFKATDPNYFSTTRFLVESASRVNAVSMLHAVFEKRSHPQSQLYPITNGVNTRRWQIPTFQNNTAARLSDKELWQIHTGQRSQLADFVAAQTGTKIDPEALTIVWAKRFASYKRLGVAFSDLEKLEKIVANAKYPVNFIIAGHAGIDDQEGKDLTDKVVELTQQERFAGKIIYMPNYSIQVAKVLVSGADLWLNTPIRGKEASGTSGMKAGLNGVLEFSTLDGWIEEVDLLDIGWTLPEGNTENNFYEIIEQQIIPAFYNRGNDGLPTEWIKRMRNTIAIVSEHYTTKRMLEEYLNKAYFPSQ